MPPPDSRFAACAPWGPRRERQACFVRNLPNRPCGWTTTSRPCDVMTVEPFEAAAVGATTTVEIEATTDAAAASAVRRTRPARPRLVREGEGVLRCVPWDMHPSR